jgi:hypothetical protein
MSENPNESMKTNTLATLLAIVALAGSTPCAAGAIGFQEQSYRYKDCAGKPAVARIPLFAAEAGVAGKSIDNVIHMVLLKAAPPPKPSATPLSLGKGSLLDGGAENLQAKVADLLGGRIVEVSFAWSECDAVADSAAIAYRFDARTGRLIAERDIFTPNGRSMLHRLLYEGRRSRVVEEVQRQERRTTLAKNKKDRQRAEQTRLLYQQCLDDRFEAGKWQEGAESLGIGGWSQHSLTFQASACASQSDAALDELGPFINKIEVAKFKPYLSDYGRYLFLGEGDGVIPADTATAQFFHGQVGDVPVTLYVGTRTSGAYAKGPLKFDSGVYFYDKYRTLIPLAVMPRDGANYEFEERDAEEKATATFAVKVDGTHLRGTWRGGSKRLPVEVARQ